MSAVFARYFEKGRKIIGVGRNYRDHAKELGNPVPETPVVFSKPATSYLWNGGRDRVIKLPPGCNELHHEVELGVVIGIKCSNISETEAMNHVIGYCLALDMTARDLQAKAKAGGLPWDIAKGFDTACPVSDFVPRTEVTDPHNVRLWCAVNGETRQDGNTNEMIFRIPTLIAYISQYFTLEPMDLILTGTPAGVGPVKSGDKIQAAMYNVGGTALQKIDFTVQGKL